MLNRSKTKQNDKGFTIIEVLIVLAIAALILLIVFLAVPALQRSARNNSRKNDAARVSASIANFISNNNGVLPGGEAGLTVAAFDTDCASIVTDVGSLSEYGTLTCNTAAAATIASGDLSLGSTTAGALTVKANGSNDGLIYVEGATCPSGAANTGAQLSLPAGNSRQSVLIYTLETATSPYNISCIQTS